LNKIPGKKGFIFNNYTPEGSSDLEMPRMYFSNENGKKIDAIRIKIREWHSTNLISEIEFYILVSCLIETVPFYANISGVYAAFRKKWDPRSIKPLILRSIPFYVNDFDNKVLNANSVDIIDEVKADIYYLDPPYNERQYAPNYHILETIAKYDNPSIKGITGLRNYDKQKSKFCNPKTAIQELETVAKNGNFKSLVMSYNSEGIMSQKSIIDMLSKYGKVKLVEFDYLRFKSNNNGNSKHKKYIKEQLYILIK
jgi:adenine-specific DNA-methyltransferase